MSRKRLVLLAAVSATVAVSVYAYNRLNTAPLMSQTALDFMASLTPEQASQARYKFQDDERFNWHFIPKERKGLPLKDMTPTQKHLAHRLLSAGLSQKGYIKATGIMSLEDVLRELEKDNGVRRNPEGYFFTIFGDPSETGTWGYRVEGHHLATNFTVSNGKVAASPNFLGANPAEVRQGPRKGLRVLHAEEDLGRELMTSLTPAQKKTALVSTEAYKDIFTMASRKASLEGQPSGLPASQLNAKQKQLLQNLIDEYVYNVPETVAQRRLEKVKKSGNSLWFAWAGPEAKGAPHYYRIQGTEFLIEYDNTQNEANHIHSVWRDIKGDFGQDLLAEHYRTSDHHR